MTFADLEIQRRLGKDNKLFKVHKLVNWQRINALLIEAGIKKKFSSKGGRRAYEPLKMLKAIILQQWHSLSDPALEQALLLRNDFAFFCSFSLCDEVPDETTFCRFRNLLIDKDIFTKILEEINFQLEEIGLKIKESKGAIVDASLIKSAARPRKTLKSEQMPKDRKEEQVLDIQEEIELSKDPDARWKKKGKRFHFGYQGYSKIDEEGRFIENVAMNSANAAEVSDFDKIVEVEKESQKNRGRRIYADKGYASRKNRKLLKDKGLKDGIMHKAARNKPLTKWQKKFNRLVSEQRWQVEQCFGTLKRRFKFERASYFGVEKVLAQMQLKAMCYNLLKAANMVEYVGVL